MSLGAAVAAVVDACRADAVLSPLLAFPGEPGAPPAQNYLGWPDKPALVVFPGPQSWRLGPPGEGGRATWWGTCALSIQVHKNTVDQASDITLLNAVASELPRVLFTAFTHRFAGTVTTLGDPMVRGGMPLRCEPPGDGTWGGVPTTALFYAFDVSIQEDGT